MFVLSVGNDVAATMVNACAHSVVENSERLLLIDPTRDILIWLCWFCCCCPSFSSKTRINSSSSLVYPPTSNRRRFLSKYDRRRGLPLLWRSRVLIDDRLVKSSCCSCSCCCCMQSSCESSYSHPKSIAKPSSHHGCSPKTNEWVRISSDGANRTIFFFFRVDCSLDSDAAALFCIE